ncbi:hypothetical protein A8990_108151 [Paenibacillus taihuensis]|uniref:Uncharacterized protein n=1 Tax=Paenibacillus taihuensis TaxID=1156355 RepID=A0A3D9S6Q8_9BACL|nr:hypothetical protein A8990_108151 [Paenibacillus taihuensis]
MPHEYADMKKTLPHDEGASFWIHFGIAFKLSAISYTR